MRIIRSCNRRVILFLFLWFSVIYWGSAGVCGALEPQQILVIANKNAAKSVGLAKYYVEKRGVPEKNLLVLWLPDAEWCSREAYDRKAAARVREHLRKEDLVGKIRCLVTVYGVPLKVQPTAMTSEERKQVEDSTKRLRALREQVKSIKDKNDNKLKGLKDEIDALQKRISALTRSDERSSLDSELALVLEENYSLAGWIPNPYFIGFGDRHSGIAKEKVLLVSRLDGPTEETVKRVIDESLETEKRGLTGKAYFDARQPRPPEENKGKTGYALYDRSIHRAADLVKKSGRMPVFVNDGQELFQPGECPDAALYCGWYSLARYVAAFKWRPGSVGYHIASSECQTLKRKDSQVWCKRMLEEGVAATLGPVGEPYVGAFPVPEMFFGLLVDGSWTLAECYALSQPFWSWQMVLVGDPLYRPFQKRN